MHIHTHMTDIIGTAVFNLGAKIDWTLDIGPSISLGRSGQISLGLKNEVQVQYFSILHTFRFCRTMTVAAVKLV